MEFTEYLCGAKTDLIGTEIGWEVGNMRTMARNVLAMTKPVVLTNLVQNGDFSNMVAGWNKSDKTGLSAGEFGGICTKAPGAPNAFRMQQNLNFISEHSYYIRCNYFKQGAAGTASPHIAAMQSTAIDSSVAFTINTFANNNSVQSLSAIVEATADAYALAVVSTQTGDWKNFTAGGFLVVDITDLPAEFTLSYIESIMKRFPDEWFDGSVDPWLDRTIVTLPDLPRVEPIFIGNPFSKTAYANNVWDMQLFDGKIYMGHGNSSNSPPEPNAGSIDVISYNLSTELFDNEYTVVEEQIDIYKVLNGKLYIPGHDPIGSGVSFYYLEDGSWVKNTTISGGIHMFDMAYYDSKIFAALGATSVNFVVSSTENDLSTWFDHSNAPDPEWNLGTPRVYTLFEFDGKLFASGNFNKLYPEINEFLIIETGQEETTLDISFDTMFPGMPSSDYIKIVKPMNVGATLLYIMGQTYNDQQFIPLSLMKMSVLGTSTAIELPDGALPVDILSRDATTYVLTYRKYSNNLYDVIVYSTTDLSNWSEVLRFSYETFARSFEEVSGDFYFGMGSYASVLPSSIGNILKVESEQY
jgi:hypothetical protein